MKHVNAVPLRLVAAAKQFTCPDAFSVSEGKHEEAVRFEEFAQVITGLLDRVPRKAV